MKLPAPQTSKPAATAAEVYAKLHRRAVAEAIETTSIEFMDEADAQRQACPIAHRAIERLFASQERCPSGILLEDWARGVLSKLLVAMETPTDPVGTLHDLLIYAERWTRPQRPAHCPFCGVTQKERRRIPRRG